MRIRNAEFGDIDRINAIHNQAIEERFKVAYQKCWTKEMCAEWFNGHNAEDYPVYVAEVDNTVAGFVYVEPYRPGRAALRQTAEISYFTDREYRRRGIARELVEYMESQCASLGIKTLFAVVIDTNEASVKLLKERGYRQWGHLPNIAVFDGVEAGHFYYGKRLCP